MKKYLLIILSFIAVSMFAQSQAEICVIPNPNHIEVKKGTYKVDGAIFSYDALKLDTQSVNTIQAFANQLSTVTGKESKIYNNIKNKGFKFELDNKLGKEEYLIDITKNGVSVKAADFNGFLYSIQTLTQMLPVEYFANTPNTNVNWVLPNCTIKDKPRFAYRGYMLDVSRHFFTIEQVKNLLNIMAMHKLNRFHWHLTDDQGWRIEIKKYPKLTEIGAYRDSTLIGPYNPKGPFDHTRYGGYYTQEQLKDIVKYAANLGITIIPEIDLPGHMVAALASYPELGCTGGPYTVRPMWDIASEVLCPGKETTFNFIEGVLAEVMDIFPSEYIHVGGDECPKKEWEKCPNCQKRITDLGIKGDNNHKAEAYLQNYVTARVQKFLNDNGRKLLGWDEILEGNLAKGATVMSWRGTKGGIEAAKNGFDVVMSPTTYCYFDYYQSKNKDTEPLAIGGYLPLEQVYSYEPYTDIPTDVQKHILGVQANLWTEYIGKPNHMEYMTLPRLDAISEVQWCNPTLKNFERFQASLKHIFQIYDILGYTYCKEIIGGKGLPGIKGGTN